nr:MAG TPA: hypothetical protein [Caudoviricetes sp.]
MVLPSEDRIGQVDFCLCKMGGGGQPGYGGT